MDRHEGELLKRKKSLLDRFLKLTEHQVAALNEENYRQLEEIIAKRQEIIEEVNLIDIQIPEMVGDGAGNAETPLLWEIEALLGKIIDIDRQNTALITANKKALLAEVHFTKALRKTHSLYQGKNVSIEGTLVDRKR